MRYWLGISLMLLLISCQSDDNESSIYSLNPPSHFPPIHYPLETNPITQEGFELGKKLFNDPRLSVDNSVACSNCHVKAVAFTDPQHNPSLGVFERAGTRNAPMIANMAFQTEFLWDGGITHLDFVSVFAIENEREMAESLVNITDKLNASSEYRTMFKSAFDTDNITSPFMLKAIAQYMLLLVSDNAKYDQVQRGEASFTNAELAGKAIFDAKCATCHSGALMTNYGFFNNGLDTTFTDIGRALISETDEDLGKFKVPSLRNITLTAPYMHDGRFETLDKVLDHYRSGIKQSPTLAPQLANGITLSDEDVEYLKAYLETLTDYDFVSNPIF